MGAVGQKPRGGGMNYLPENPVDLDEIEEPYPDPWHIREVIDI